MATGFFKMMTGLADIELKPVLLNGTYAIMKSYTKPYVSCRYTHPAVEAAIQLRNRYGIQAEEVQEIHIKTYYLAVSGHDHTDIAGSYSAKMSIPYSTAVGLIYGKAGLQEFAEETAADARVLDLTRKVHVQPNRELSQVFPAVQTAIVSIKTEKGAVSARVDFPKGEPENPLTDQEFRSRYDELMKYAGIELIISSSVFDSVYNHLNVTVNEIVKDL